MTWKEIKNECLKLMDTYSRKGNVIPTDEGNNKDYLLAMPGAATLTQYDIAKVSPIIRMHVIRQEKGDAAPLWHEYDMRELTKEDGMVCFLRLADRYLEDVPALVLPDGHTLRISGRYEGEYKVFYHAVPQEITGNTEDDFEPELAPDAVRLMPLGMAATLFKNDDLTIASTIWNEYVQRMDAIRTDMDPAGRAEYVSVTGWL